MEVKRYTSTRPQLRTGVWSHYAGVEGGGRRGLEKQRSVTLQRGQGRLD